MEFENNSGVIEAWNNLEASEDWDNEEYTGSLTETKVFTPSANFSESMTMDENMQEAQAAQNLGEMPKMPEVSVIQQQQQQQSLVQQQNASTMQPVLNMPTHMLSQQSIAVSSGGLTAAQTQYLTQLTQQTSESLKASGQTGYSTTAASQVKLKTKLKSNLRIEALVESVRLLICFLNANLQPQRQAKQRPRVPPPSKIPATAVEMPGDAVNSSMGLLDVQFGALDVTSSLEGTTTEKYSSSIGAISGIEVSSSSNAVNTSATTNSLDIESSQASSNQYNANTMVLFFTINTKQLFD